MPFQIIRNDITKVAADAIVNTANPAPRYATGTDRAVYMAAGAEKLLAERKAIGEMRRGEVHVTDAYGLNAKYIIHTVGPVWIDGTHEELQTLASCYRKSLHLAEKLGCRSIAFPLISTGVYGFPKDKALDIALSEIRTFLETSEMDVTLVVFNRSAYQLSETLTESVRQFIDDNYCRTAEAAEYDGLYPAALRENGRGRRGTQYAGMAADEAAEMEEGTVGTIGDEAAGMAAEGASVMPPAESPGIRRENKVEGAAGRQKPNGSGLPGWLKGSIFKPSSASPAGTAIPGKPKTDAGVVGHPIPDAGAAAGKAAGPGPILKETTGPGPILKETTDSRSIWKETTGPGRKKSLQDVIDHVGESFREMVLRLMDEKGLKGPDVYGKANIDKKLFSKIRTNPDYVPKKTTAVALAVALHLNLDETVDLLRRAGLALSPSSIFDLIVQYCIEHRIYDVYEINAILFDYDQPLLGSQ